jgi:hypothetical protein
VVPTFSSPLSKLDKNGSCRSPLAESEKLSRKGHLLPTWPHHQKFAWCASTVHMITTFVVCVMAVFVKDVSCYLRLQSAEMSNLFVHLVIALQGLILHFNLSVDSSDVNQGLLDGTTLSLSPDGPPLKIGPFLGRLSSKPKDLHIAILSLFLKDSHAESSGFLEQVLGEYLHGQCDGCKVVNHHIPFDFGGSSHLNYQESSQAFIKNVAPNRFVWIFLLPNTFISNPINSFLSSRLPQIAFVMESVFLEILLALQSTVV